MVGLSITKRSRLLKASGIIVISIGATCSCYQIYQTYHSLKKIVNTDVFELEKKRAQYIYIDDPKLKEEVSYMLQDGDAEKKRGTRYVFDLPMKWWKTWKHSYAWRLLTIAQSDDLGHRLRAVRTLASLKVLKASDLQQLAQVCDARTAVGLARSEEVDFRFFLQPPYVHVLPNKTLLIERFHSFLLALNYEKNHPCIDYFIKKAFPKFSHRYLNLHDDHTALEGSKQLIRDEDILPMCVENLLHHSAIPDNSKDIWTMGGLPFLMDLGRYFRDEPAVLVNLGKIMSNISCYQNTLHDIFVSGWLGVLARWSHSADPHLAAVAARTLANLDTDDRAGVYSRRIYLLHPVARTTHPAQMDVVFTHGLLGGVFITWRQRDGKLPPCPWNNEAEEVETSDSLTQEYMRNVSAGMEQEWEEVLQEYEMVMADCPEHSEGLARGPYSFTGSTAYRLCKQVHKDRYCYTACWPKDWLPADCPHLRIIGINYDTNISAWSPGCPLEKYKRSINDRSEELLVKLKKAGLGKRPIVWVSHSMGGLLVKNMLVSAWESDDESTKDLCRNTKGIVFYSTPHAGSPVAKLSQATALLLWPSMEVQDLRENSPTLAILHSKFLAMLREHPMKIVSFVETKPTDTVTVGLRFTFHFVPVNSANLGVGEFYAVPQDHQSICKPATRHSFLYQKVLHVIQDCLAASSQT